MRNKEPSASLSGVSKRHKVDVLQKIPKRDGFKLRWFGCRELCVQYTCCFILRLYWILPEMTRCANLRPHGSAFSLNAVRFQSSCTPQSSPLKGCLRACVSASVRIETLLGRQSCQDERWLFTQPEVEESPCEEQHAGRAPE